MSEAIVAPEAPAEITRLLNDGQALLCPRCRYPLKTIPAEWQRGRPLHGVECSRAPRHWGLQWHTAEEERRFRALFKTLRERKR